MSRFRSAPSRPEAEPLADVPMVSETPRRQRLRRGGPRTPMPLVGFIAVAAGIGIAYVSQIAHATQSTYQAAQLQAAHTDLANQAATLDDQINRLRSTERIVAAAQQNGMRPATKWTYVAATPVPVISVTPHVAAQPVAPSDPLEGFIAALGSAVGVHDTGQIP